MTPILPTLLLALPAPPAPLAGGEWIIPSGERAVYDTALGRLRLDRLEIQAGASLHVVGEAPFVLVARDAILVDGLLDLSGDANPGVLTLNTTDFPEYGAAGQAGGGQGGTGSVETDTSTPSGLPGLDRIGSPRGGGGGESSYSTLGKDARRGAGGGGGTLAADQPESANPDDPANWGLVAGAGQDGGANGLGAISQSAPAVGGAVGPRVFVDGDPLNDFWGVQDTASGPLVGELAWPQAGRGGGAGGDAVDSATFPSVPFEKWGDEKGAGGGGGGGLALVLTRRLTVGPSGRIVSDGGDGGFGENVYFFDHVGGGSGGGSGGMLVLEADVIDLTAAQADALSARGGIGGLGMDHKRGAAGAGGDGGPGIIQLHVTDASRVLLPTGVTLDALSVPNAHVLLPILR